MTAWELPEEIVKGQLIIQLSNGSHVVALEADPPKSDDAQGDPSAFQGPLTVSLTASAGQYVLIDHLDTNLTLQATDRTCFSSFAHTR